MISRLSVLFGVCVMLSSMLGQAIAQDIGTEPIRISPSITIQNRTNVQVLVNASPSRDPDSLAGGVNLNRNGTKTFSVVAPNRNVLVMAYTKAGHWAFKSFPVNRVIYVQFSGNQLNLTDVRPR